MSKEKDKQRPKSASSDEQTKTKKKSNDELTEQDLHKTSGGQWLRTVLIDQYQFANNLCSSQ